MKRILIAGLVAAASLSLPATASADFLITPYLGKTWGGSTIESPANYGLSLMWLSTTGIGLEADFTTIPDFFEPDELEDFDVIGDNGVTILMGNVVLGGRGGGIKPYVAGGMGLLRQKVADFGELLDITENAFGVNVGGGLRVGSSRFSVRGDVRYFRSLTEPDDILQFDLSDFSFWRGSVGVSIGF